MLIISTFSSHKIGMGHFFRSINLARQFNKKTLFLINKNKKCVKFLKNIKYEVVDYKKKNWEIKYIKKNTIWINDRLNTNLNHVKLLQNRGVFVVSIDDNGNGGKISNLNFAQNINITKTNSAKKRKFLILKKVNSKKIWVRKKINSIMVTLGGADTYNLTNKVIKKIISLNLNLKISVFVGPETNLSKNIIKNKNINYKFSVKNLENQMCFYDLIICGGGVTPFNAASQGLPSFVIANEKHEINTAKYLQKLKVSHYCGYKSININNKLISKIKLTQMSKNGISKFDNNSLNNVIDDININYAKFKKNNNKQ